MLVYDINDNLIEEPDLTLGKLKPDKKFIKHHPAIEAVEEEGHYEITAVYPSGGKDIAWIVDVPGIQAKEAWDEFIDILRYIEYTPEELEKLKQPSAEERIAELEEQIKILTEMMNSYASTIPEL